MAERASIPSERLTLAGAGADAENSWEWVTWRYSTALHRFFAHRVNNPADVSDLVQKVFVRVIQRSKGEPIENVQGYLFQVAASVLNDEYRRARVRHQDDHESYDENVHDLHSEISPERILLGEEAVMRIAAAVKQLPETTRDVYILRVHRECEYAEIARQLGISERGAQRHMAQALKYLEEVLEGDLPLNGASPRRSK
jgi:RNA polymerase sigma-70 factor (ECF subfamily)